jgi:hypothetical protein
MKHCNVLIAATVIVAGSFPLVAMGQTTPPIPDACNTTLGRRAFNSGVQLGTGLADAAWANVNDCDRVDDFNDIITDDVGRYQLAPNPSNYTYCRYSGVIAGVLDELAVILDDCAGQCRAEGEIVGQISAMAYCELSLALGGLSSADAFLRGPVATCGASFQEGCDPAFDSFSQNYTNTLGACLQYTEGDYADVWDQARYYQCAYNPLPPNSGP